MIVQNRGATQVFYVPELDEGAFAVGKELGLCTGNGESTGEGTVTKVKYMTDCNREVDAWHLKGRSVEVFVLASRLKLTSPVANDLVKVLNSFNSPLFSVDKFQLPGRYTASSGKGIVAANGTKFTTSKHTMKDLPGIYNLMANLGANNAAILHPVIARYVYAMRQMPKKSEIQPVGYLDLGDYMKVLCDDRRNMFVTMNSTADINMQFGNNPYVEVTSIDPQTQQARLSFGDVAFIDMEKARGFRPHVIITTKPLEIHQDMKFPWTRVVFDRTVVFLTPLMSMPDAWKSLAGGIDLLSPRTYNFK